MIRKLSLALLASCLLLVTSCSKDNDIKIGEVFEDSVNTYEGVSMAVKESTPTTAIIEILGTTDNYIEYGNRFDFSLQVEQDDIWYWLELKRAQDNTSEACDCEKDVPAEQELEWATEYGTLPAGNYRIVKSFSQYIEDADNVQFLISAEFTVD